MKYDYLIVGCGLFGSTFARLAANFNKSSLIIDKNDYIAGNCYTVRKDNIDVHIHGPHTFHTGNEWIWNFINQFGKFNDYKHKCLINYQDKYYSFPINLTTLKQVYKTDDIDLALFLFNADKSHYDNVNNMEQWLLNNVGATIYEMFYKGYTKKQWGIEPNCLPPSIAKRIPIRLNYDDTYFNDKSSKYQGIPIDGYTKLIENVLDDKFICVGLNENYFNNRDKFNSIAKTIIYTGKIDEYFDYVYGCLNYRSLKFEFENYDQTYQSHAIINYADVNVPFTRIVEYKHFLQLDQEHTIVCKEYPIDYDKSNVPYYPCVDDVNLQAYDKYRKLINGKVRFGGRLGSYKYLNMDQTIAAAKALYDKL